MESLQLWTNSLATRAEGTRHQYFLHFSKFLEWTGMSADELREMKFQEDQASRPWERSKVENMVRTYLQAIENRYSCSTRKLAFNAVKSFFACNGMCLNLTPSDKPSGCAFGSRVPTKEDVRAMSNGTESLRNRALMLFLKDSGLRESDLAKLKWKDLKDYGEGFLGFEIQTKKGKTKARGFVGPETTEALRLYKEKRLNGTRKILPEQNIEDHPVFALEDKTEKAMRPAFMSEKVGNVIRLVGLEGVTAHGLRKFWEQNMHLEKLAYQKQMNGRALNDVERAYFWKETEELFEMYKANYHNLTIAKQEFREVEERLRREYERETKTLKERIYELEQKNLELTQRLNGFTLSGDQVQELLRRIEKLEKQEKG